MRKSVATLTLLVALGVTASAHAGTYTVIQCDRASDGLNPGAPDAQSQEPWAAYEAINGCKGDDSALKVNSVAATMEGRYARWRYLAPPGTTFTTVSVGARLVRDAGHQPSLYVDGPGSDGVDGFAGDAPDGAWHGEAWHAGPAESRTEFGARLRCAPVSGDSCAHSPSADSWIRNVQLTLNDSTAPTMLVDGALVSGGWQAGTKSLAVSAHDSGSGVRRIQVSANGATAASRVFECETIPGRALAARLQPCASDQVAAFDLNTARAPFHEGSNQVQVCVEDYGSSSVNRTCTNRTVKTDNVGPGPPQNLTVAGGSDWRYTNDFDISWENPEQPATAAPLDGAVFEVVDESGSVVEGPLLVRDPRANTLLDRSVPEPGSYELRIWLLDQAGNEDPSQSAEVLLRFDDSPPGSSHPARPPGWLSRRELAGPFIETWSLPDSVPVSGIKGYAIAVDRFPSTNPCETSSDPDPAVCAQSELTHIGPDPRSQVLSNLPDGASFIHVAAASGSGIRSSGVGHAELDVDRMDPSTQLLGTPSGWTNDPVTLVARATDSLSGMQPSPDDDDAPYTAMRIDDGPTLSDPDNEVTSVLAEEGDHLVRFWARDLAGNENDGDPGGAAVPPNNQPGVLRVKIDRTTPSVAFANAQDPSDPELVRAMVTDSLSGLASGRISYRPPGQEDWQPLVTRLTDEGLEATVPSEALPDGPYEFRAEASDQAGNTGVTTEREDGTEMVLQLPLKAQTELRASIGSSGDTKTVGYGHPSRAEGRLVDGSGKPIAGEVVEVAERFDDGSLAADRSREVVTDEEGRFSVGVAPGTSRSLQVSYAGSTRYTATDSGRLRLDVEGDAQLTTTKRRPRVGQRFRFRGRVKHFAARMPQHGKLVELQVRRPEGWDTVRQAFRTRSNGRWSFRFHFGNYYFRPTTFRFRLKVVREGGWPYRPVTTGSRRVTVVPR